MRAAVVNSIPNFDFKHIDKKVGEQNNLCRARSAVFSGTSASDDA